MCVGVCVCVCRCVGVCRCACVNVSWLCTQCHGNSYGERGDCVNCTHGHAPITEDQ